MSSKNSSHHTDSDVETHSDKETCDDRESQFSSDHFPHPHADQPILADPQRLHTSSAGVNSLPPRFQEPFASIDEVRKCWQSFAAEASVSYNVMRSTSDRYALECPTAARPAARPAVRPHAAVINVEDFNVADADHDPADIPADIPAILVDSAAGAADAAARIPACGFSFVAREHSRGGTHVTVVAYTPHSEECPCEPRPRGEYVQQCAMDLLKSLGDEQARVAKPKALRQHLRIACGVPRICASVLSVRLQLAKAAYFREDASEFLKLPAFFAEVAAQNPRTTAFVVTNDDDTIKRAFMALGCGIDMLDHCIPVLAVDAAHMKSQHKGIIMSLTAKDGERAVVPLAVAVVFGSESTESWTWFLTACRNHFPQLRTAPQAGRFTVVHDRMKGLIAAHREVFADPFIPDVFCFTHLLRNMKDTFRHQAPTQLFTEAAYATNEEDYNAAINALSPEHRAWVDNIGAGEDDDNVAGGATKWALAWSTRPRYGIMTSNVAESVNSWMESMRSMWPLRLFESWLAHVASKFHKRREEVRGMVDDNGRPLHLPRSSMVKQWGEKKIDARRYEIKRLCRTNLARAAALSRVSHRHNRARYAVLHLRRPADGWMAVRARHRRGAESEDGRQPGDGGRIQRCISASSVFHLGGPFAENRGLFSRHRPRRRSTCAPKRVGYGEEEGAPKEQSPDSIPQRATHKRQAGKVRQLWPARPQQAPLHR